MKNRSYSVMLSALAISMTQAAFAELQPITDDELSEYSGQGAVAFDIEEIGATSYTRVTLGMEADLQMNIDTLEAGRYAKAGETYDADINITNLSFGSISTDANQLQLDGQAYAINDIIPFELNDPFFEIARDDNDELTGFRIGFGEARGQLSGDFNSISGNVEAEVVDFFGTQYQTTMLDTNGDQDSSRSSYFGASNAQTGGATDCSLGLYCYNLADYKTLDIGARNATTGQVDYTSDFFISFQKEATDWQTDNGMISTGLGAFINLPTAMQIDLTSGINATGTDRVRSEYIDRGNGLF